MRRHPTLSTSQGFDRVFRAGARAVDGPVACAIHVDPAGGPVRFGFVTGKKIGNAVKRNRAKRLLRESAWRLASGLPAGAEVILSARPSIDGKSFQEVAAACRRCIQKAGIAC